MSDIMDPMNTIAQSSRVRLARNYADVPFPQRMGDYDYETRITTHYTDDVYAFDTEMFDIEGAYTELLNAVERLSGGAAACTYFM